MKKLIVGQIVNTRIAICDLCHEGTKECITLSRNTHVPKYETKIESFFTRVEEVVVNAKIVEELVDFDLCFDCISQLKK